MKKVLYSDSPENDLTRWIGCLKALGETVLSLGADKDGTGGETLTCVGEDLGMMIRDYAEAINEAVDEAYITLGEFFDNGEVSFLGRLKSAKKDIEEGSLGPEGNLYVANKNIQAINDFICNDFYEITQLVSWFGKTAKLAAEQLNKSQQEKAHATAQGGE